MYLPEYGTAVPAGQELLFCYFTFLKKCDPDTLFSVYIGERLLNRGEEEKHDR